MDTEYMAHLASLALAGQANVAEVYSTHVLVNGYNPAPVKIHDQTAWNYLNERDPRLMKVESTFAAVSAQGHWYSIPRGLVAIAD